MGVYTTGLPGQANTKSESPHRRNSTIGGEGNDYALALRTFSNQKQKNDGVTCAYAPDKYNERTKGSGRNQGPNLPRPAAVDCAINDIRESPSVACPWERGHEPYGLPKFAC